MLKIYNMDYKSNKFILCVLPTQYGKTFTVISKIDTEINQDNNKGRSIHIIYTMNTLFNNKQFAKRLETIEIKYGKQSVCVFSSKYNGTYTHIKKDTELKGLCLDIKTCPRVIVMCSNTNRFKDGTNFLDVLNRNETNIKRVYVYYDELHKYINTLLRKQIEKIHKYDIVFGIMALSATPSKIFDEKKFNMKHNFWSEIKLITLDNFYDTNYVGYRDIHFNCIELKNITRKKETNIINYVEHILNMYPNILQNNTLTFIPGHIKVDTHKHVRDLVIKTNKKTVIITINGIIKNIEYNNKIFNLNTNEDICEQISSFLITNNLQKKPIVITGFLCVSLGQTLTHRNIGSFTSAIISHLDLTNDDVYQLFGRITGRMKDWTTYRQTQVYCPANIKNICITMEECARNMAFEHNGEWVSRYDYDEPLYELGII